MALVARVPWIAVALVVLPACGEKEHRHAPASVGRHVHTALHGGTLVEIGDHAYNLELLLDPAAGRLTAWVLDAHAENFVRLRPPTIELTVTAGGDQQALTLAAVANSATGETVGDTSQFEAQAAWLKGATGLAGSIGALEIKGAKFERIAFRVALPAK